MGALHPQPKGLASYVYIGGMVRLAAIVCYLVGALRPTMVHAGSHTARDGPKTAQGALRGESCILCARGSCSRILCFSLPSVRILI